MNRFVYRRKMARPKHQDLHTIDYKNLSLLRNHLMESGRIMPSRITGVSAHQQRELTRAIKLARYIALIPYTDKQQQ